MCIEVVSGPRSRDASPLRRCLWGDDALDAPHQFKSHRVVDSGDVVVPFSDVDQAPTGVGFAVTRHYALGDILDFVEGGSLSRTVMTYAGLPNRASARTYGLSSCDLTTRPGVIEIQPELRQPAVDSTAAGLALPPPLGGRGLYPGHRQHVKCSWRRRGNGGSDDSLTQPRSALACLRAS